MDSVIESSSVTTNIIDKNEEWINNKTQNVTKIQTREEAIEEWSKVPTILSNNLQIKSEITSPIISIEEAIQHFKTYDFPKITGKAAIEKTKFSELFRWVKPSNLNDELLVERTFVTSLTQCSLDWSDVIQCRILQTIYKKLTGAQIDCPQRGTHWQLVGFQGNDPATDLRGVGLFGLLQFLYLTTDEMLPLGHKLYKVANADDQPFPLAVLSLNLTNIVLNIFNNGKLNRECNTRKSVVNTLNLFYAALLVYTFNIWVTQKKTIKDSGYILKDAERYCSRNVKKVLKDLPKNLQKYDANNLSDI
ncbi:hypothetical protein O3M35_012679 [Rhynocoris fuscipes]|uniref:ELMO domain-containing protein n=1 Tax=Rhynocoris fuscipes TaxID=488301 RepID=A0AAW1CUG1_9HEMI